MGARTHDPAIYECLKTTDSKRIYAMFYRWVVSIFKCDIIIKKYLFHFSENIYYIYVLLYIFIFEHKKKWERKWGAMRCVYIYSYSYVHSYENIHTRMKYRKQISRDSLNKYIHIRTHTRIHSVHIHSTYNRVLFFLSLFLLSKR